MCTRASRKLTLWSKNCTIAGSCAPAGMGSLSPAAAGGAYVKRTWTAPTAMLTTKMRLARRCNGKACDSTPHGRHRVTMIHERTDDRTRSSHRARTRQDPPDQHLHLHRHLRLPRLSVTTPRQQRVCAPSHESCGRGVVPDAQAVIARRWEFLACRRCV